MNTPLVSEVLYAAANDIDAFGHHKDDSFGDGPLATAPACAIGALNRAAAVAVGGDWFKGDIAARPARVALTEHVGGGIVHWNDAPERTKEQVVEAFRAAAVVAQAREDQESAWATYTGVVTA